jgi:hypothetical protein
MKSINGCGYSEKSVPKYSTLAFHKINVKFEELCGHDLIKYVKIVNVVPRACGHGCGRF